MKFKSIRHKLVFFISLLVITLFFVIALGTYAYFQHTPRFGYYYVLGMCLVLLISIILAWKLGAYLTKPLERLTAQIYHLAQPGADKQKRLESNGLDELRLLRDSFNTLLDEVLRHEQELKESEMRYRLLFDGSRDAMVTIAPPSWHFFSSNPAALEMFGAKDIAQLSTLGPWDVSPEHQSDGALSVDKSRDMIQTAQQAGSCFFEWVHQRLDGAVFPATILITQLKMAGQTFLLWTIRDISAQKKVEVELKASMSLLNASLESTADGLLVVDRNGKRTLYNQKFVDMWQIPVALLADPGDEPMLKYVVAQMAHPEDFLSKVLDLYEKPEESSLDILHLADGRIFQRYSQPQRIGDEVVGRAWSFQDITAQKLVEEELLETNNYLELATAKANTMAAQAEMASYAKSEFLANMSHEIRTPLNGVIGFTDLLIKTPLNAVQQQYVANVSISAHSLLDIINHILDFSKIEAGKLELETIKTDIVELAEQATDIIKYQAFQKGLELLVNIQPDLPRFALVDPVRLKQILVNLLSNAVKFTQKGEVELKITFTPEEATTGRFSFSIRDTGIGITAQQQKKLFRVFTQADGSTTRKFGGTGLGLVISNLLAEKMGGKIQIHSKLGQGAQFFFTIETECEAGEKSPAACLKEIQRVLVIDDNPNNRGILEHIFQHWGITFVGCDSGSSALKQVNPTTPFDVITVDYLMPHLNGLETIKMIREQWSLPPEKQPFILLHSSAEDVGIHELCQQLGVRFNLIKPVKTQELFHALRHIHLQPDPDATVTQVPLHQLTLKMPSDAVPVVLVAEDVEMNMLLVVTIIKQWLTHVEILEAKNGREALDIVKTKRPDIILMDIQMPEMDGFEATERIRQFEKKKGGHIPIIALTAGAVKGEAEKCLNAGMDGFLTKPLEQATLRKILETHLASVYHAKETYPRAVDTPDCQTLLHFDRNMLLERIGNDMGMLQKLIAAFSSQFCKYMESLKKAIEEKNTVEIHKYAHTIKGSARNMSFTRLAELAKAIEENTAHIERLPAIMDTVFLEWEELQVILKNSNE